MNNNGILTSGNKHIYLTSPPPFENLPKESEAFLAVLWSDLATCDNDEESCDDNDRTGTVYYRYTSNISLLAEADRRIHQAYGESARKFRTEELTVVTWDNVGHFGLKNKVLPYQVTDIV